MTFFYLFRINHLGSGEKRCTLNFPLLRQIKSASNLIFFHYTKLNSRAKFKTKLNRTFDQKLKACGKNYSSIEIL